MLNTIRWSGKYLNLTLQVGERAQKPWAPSPRAEGTADRSPERREASDSWPLAFPSPGGKSKSWSSLSCGIVDGFAFFFIFLL